MVKHLKEGENLKDIIQNDPFLVDFYADWCGPCQMLAPILEEVTFINVLKVNVDLFPDIAKQFGIMSIPTLIFFKDGKEVKKEIGFRNIEELKKIVNDII